MQSSAKTVEEYLNELPTDRKDCLTKLRAIINENLPESFKKLDQIPYKRIGELAAKITPEAWIRTYESSFKK